MSGSGIQKTSAKLAARSRAIDESIKREHRLQRKNRGGKVLVLGHSGTDAGKSTFLNQLELMYNDGPSHSDLDQCRIRISWAVSNSLTAFVQCLVHLNYTVPHEIGDVHNRYPGIVPMIPEQCAAKVHELWTNSKIRSTVSENWCLVDCGPHVEYFLDNILRMASRDYHPTANDVLRVNFSPQTQVRTTIIQAEPRQRLEFFQLNSMPSYCWKWRPFFEDVDLVMYFVDFANYQSILDSTYTFGSIVNSSFYARHPFIVVCNKVDVFKHKLSKVPLTSVFDDYGGSTVESVAMNYIIEKFVQQRRFVARSIARSPTIFMSGDTTDATFVQELLGRVQSEVTASRLMREF